MTREGRRALELAHDRALADWLEADAAVAALRRSAATAAARAAERARGADALWRSGRRDSFAQGAADAARVLAVRAVADEARLMEGIRLEQTLRARLAAAKAALAAPPGAPAGTGAIGEALRCG